MYIIQKPLEMLRSCRVTISLALLVATTLTLVNSEVCSTNAHVSLSVKREKQVTKQIYFHKNPNPFANAKLFIDPESNAKKEADLWRNIRPQDAASFDKIASQPQADWFGDWNQYIQQDVNNRVLQIAQAGALPVLVAYNIPKRDCNSYSAGGAISPDAYKNWITAFANGIGNQKAVVILEPDALAMLDCLPSNADREIRIQLISYAIDVLKSKPNITVYVDAGHSNWIRANVMAQRLQKAGIHKADGFATNVSNFMSVQNEIKYGKELSSRIGGKRFIIDTSRNGNGPLSTSKEGWCNPKGRALGPQPTSKTGNSLVDAFFWIKRPGESDGTCNGGKPSGQWWPEYALLLAQRAK